MDHWIVGCAAATLLARVGLALYNCGLVRAKNAGGSLLRHMADLCIASLAFWAVGIALYSPASAGNWFQSRYLFGLRGDDAASLAPRVLMMLTATLIATGVVVGALSEQIGRASCRERV